MFKGNTVCRGLINSFRYAVRTLGTAHGVLDQAVMFLEVRNHVKKTTIFQNIRRICTLENKEDGL